MSDFESPRLLLAAFVASLLMHLLAAASLPGPIHHEFLAPPPLQVHLLDTPKPADREVPEASRPSAAPLPQPHAPRLAPQPSRQKRAAYRSAEPSSRTASVKPDALVPAQSPAQHHPAPPVMRGQSAAPVPPTPRTAAPAASAPVESATPPKPEGDAQAQTKALERAYQGAVAAAMRDFQDYPSIALARRWQGVVALRIEFAPGGSPGAVVVETGSGHGVLDDKALAVVRQIRAWPPVPAALKGRRFALHIKVRFVIDQQSGG